MFGAEVALATRSAAARGELADFDKARKGSSAFIARCCSMRGKLIEGFEGVVVVGVVRSR